MSHTIEAPKELLSAQKIANLLDTAVRVPVIGVKIGLDFLVGLIPGIGDAIMLLSSLRIVQLGNKLGMPKSLQAKMLKNALLDFCLGFIPVVGDVFDIFFKANKKNVHIMEMWWVEQNKATLDKLTQQRVQQWEAEQADR